MSNTKYIAFGNLKGGVAKTISCYNVAGFLADQGKKVLILDLDPQGNLTTYAGINRRCRELDGLEFILGPDKKKDNPANIVKKAPIEGLPTLDILPSTVRLSTTECDLWITAAKEFQLKYNIEKYHDFYSQYDYVLMDTNPSMGVINLNAFYVADHILIPIIADVSGIDGTQQFFMLWDRFREQLKKEDNISSVFVTRVGTSKMDRQFYDELHKTEECKDIIEILLKTQIYENADVKKSAAQKKIPLCKYENKNCKGYSQYKELVQELLDKEIL